jgi:hypothetical protein
VYFVPLFSRLDDFQATGFEDLNFLPEPVAWSTNPVDWISRPGLSA